MCYQFKASSKVEKEREVSFDVQTPLNCNLIRRSVKLYYKISGESPFIQIPKESGLNSVQRHERDLR